MTRVRFAPSPTGFLHIGGARTALFNWMYARSQGGKFILRIEDTDRARSKQEYLEEILDSMTWLGLNWDEFYKQSDRFGIYRKYADQLVGEGKAYKDGEAVILRVPQKTIKMYDLIRDEISVDTNEIKDQVLMKSDGTPTYSFACAIDDALMEISCVIRGEDHISNTPKQILIYEALGFKVPKFAHLPLILDPEGGRMSKRAGATAVTEYRSMGYLPEAVVNYLMLLGWSPGNNQEMVTMTSALKTFSIKKINKAGAAFSIDKLTWLNTQYIKQLDQEKLTDAVIPLLKEKEIPVDGQDRERVKFAVSLYKGRMKTLNEFVERTSYLFSDTLEIAPEVLSSQNLSGQHDRFAKLAERLEAVEPFGAAGCEQAFRAVVGSLGIVSGDLVHPVRVALTGSDVGPGLFETMELLGKAKTLARLRRVYP